MSSMKTCLSSLLVAAAIQVSLGGNYERSLLARLFAQYNKIERPVAAFADNVTVVTDLNIIGIPEIDPEDGILTVTAQLVMTWQDVNLRWDPTQYGGIDNIRVPSSSVWRPDLYLFNSASDKFDLDHPSNVVVTANGTVLHVPPLKMSFFCANISVFTSDGSLSAFSAGNPVTCELKMGSWTYPSDQVDLYPLSLTGNTKYYIPRRDLELVGTTADRKEQFYDDVGYVFLSYTLDIKRS